MANQKARASIPGNEGQTDKTRGVKKTGAGVTMGSRRVNRVGSITSSANSNHPDDNKRTIRDGRFTG